MAGGMTDHSFADMLLDIGAVTFNPDVPLILSSKLKSPVYIDSRTLIYNPYEWQAVIHAFESIIEDEEMAFEVVAGVSVGGIPHSSVLAYNMGNSFCVCQKIYKRAWNE